VFTAWRNPDNPSRYLYQIKYGRRDQKSTPEKNAFFQKIKIKLGFFGQKAFFNNFKLILGGFS
jgi:hypothetical protein